jgi:hypothetical protein
MQHTRLNCIPTQNLNSPTWKKKANMKAFSVNKSRPGCHGSSCYRVVRVCSLYVSLWQNFLDMSYERTRVVAREYMTASHVASHVIQDND